MPTISDILGRKTEERSVVEKKNRYTERITDRHNPLQSGAAT